MGAPDRPHRWPSRGVWQQGLGVTSGQIRPCCPRTSWAPDRQLARRSGRRCPPSARSTSKQPPNRPVAYRLWTAGIPSPGSIGRRWCGCRRVQQGERHPFEHQLAFDQGSRVVRGLSATDAAPSPAEGMSRLDLRHGPGNDRHLTFTQHRPCRPPPTSSSNALRTSPRAATYAAHRGACRSSRNPPGLLSSPIGQESCWRPGFDAALVTPPIRHRQPGGPRAAGVISPTDRPRRG